MADAHWVAATTRPVIMGTRYMISAGHYLAAAAGMRILDKGGNAFDAGVAAALCVNVLQPDLTNIGGVAPICIFHADSGAVETISGLGWWPAAADPEFFRRERGGRMGRGIHRCIMPAAMDAWLTTLQRHGTMRFGEIADSAIELAEDGFAMHPVMHETLSDEASLRAMRGWASTRAVFLPDGEPVAVGRRVVQRDLARTLRILAAAEQGAPSREAGLEAARACFYTGEIGQAMANFVAAEGGWITLQDLAAFRVAIEPSVSLNYRGYDIHACGPWCQGPVVPMALNILEGYDIASLGANSAALYHLVIEALKAAFADRDKYFTDPRFGAVPMDGLLAKGYGAQWRSRIDPHRASPGMPEPGEPWAFSAAPPRREASRWRHPDAAPGVVEPDTSYLCVVDSAGNAFSATPSDGVTSAPLVPGYGFMISSRGMQSWLDPDHPSVMAPRKRPRLTPSPGMVLKDGRLVMPYGTPGNDVQPQAMVQFLINVIDFGMDVQAAMEAPRCATYSYPRSSDPHPYSPGQANIEGRVDPSVLARLQALGHGIKAWPGWTGSAGSLGAIRVDHGTGVLHGGADPRRTAYAIGR